MKFEKLDGINILISLVIALGIYYIFNYMNEPATSWYVLFTFILMSIFLKLSDIGRKK